MEDWVMKVLKEADIGREEVKVGTTTTTTTTTKTPKRKREEEGGRNPSQPTPSPPDVGGEPGLSLHELGDGSFYE